MKTFYVVSKEQIQALKNATTLYETNILVTAIKNQRPEKDIDTGEYTDLIALIEESIDVLKKIRGNGSRCALWDRNPGGCSIRCRFNNHTKYNPGSNGCGLFDFRSKLEQELKGLR